MNKLIEFFKDILTEDDGKPSSARVRAVWWDFVVAWLIFFIFRHLFGVSDARLQIWLANLPFLIFSLVVLTNSGYLINQCGIIFSGFFNKGKKDDDNADNADKNGSKKADDAS